MPAITTATPTNWNTSTDNSVGTWKLIKGKVTQAMEDIKSSKNDSKTICDSNLEDSDADSTTINSSISDDFNDMASLK